MFLIIVQDMLLRLGLNIWALGLLLLLFKILDGVVKIKLIAYSVNMRPFIFEDQTILLEWYIKELV